MGATGWAAWGATGSGAEAGDGDPEVEAGRSPGAGLAGLEVGGRGQRAREAGVPREAGGRVLGPGLRLRAGLRGRRVPVAGLVRAPRYLRSFPDPPGDFVLFWLWRKRMQPT